MNLIPKAIKTTTKNECRKNEPFQVVSLNLIGGRSSLTIVPSLWCKASPIARSCCERCVACISEKNAKGYSTRKDHTRRMQSTHRAIDHLGAGRSVREVLLIFSCFVTTHDITCMISHAMNILYQFCSFEKISGTWVIKGFQKLLCMVTYLKKKAKESRTSKIFVVA